VARLGNVGQQRIVAGILAVMGLKPRKAQPTVAPVRTTVPSTSMVRRGRARTLDRLDDESVVSWTNGARVACENCRNQLPTVRRREAGQAAEAGDQGIAGDIAQVLQAARPDVEQGQDSRRERPPP